MRLAIATDAWTPQVNGVVRSLCATVEQLQRRGVEIALITPSDFLTVPMPGYASIRLAMAPRFGVRRKLHAFAPDLVHVSTEGPIGWAARGWCLSQSVPFTSAFHTHFPQYAAVRTGISADRFWPIMRRFHAQSRCVLVSTASLANELAARGIPHTARWSRGIDGTLFRPDGPMHPALASADRPILLYVGRVAPEKNLDAFLSSKVPGMKVVVGDGPALTGLRQRYPDAIFMGALAGEALACAYRSADCFVFPSRTDTFGLVVIEALASGVPVAAYPVQGPLDILGRDGLGPDGELPGAAGVLSDDLDAAIRQALTLDRDHAARLGSRFSWESATDQFQRAITEALCASASEARLAA